MVLHDPLSRPDRYLGRDDFLALWGPHPWAVIAEGYLLVVIGRRLTYKRLTGKALPAMA